MYVYVVGTNQHRSQYNAAAPVCFEMVVQEHVDSTLSHMSADRLPQDL